MLDLGCGPGVDAAVFAQLGVNVVGLDVTPSFLRRVREHFVEVTADVAADCQARASFVRGDMRSLPFEADSFDGIWASGSFHHVPREQAVSEYEQVTTVRFPNVVGLDAPRGQAQDMIEEGLAGEIEVWGHGEIRRPYVDVANLSSALVELGTGSLTVETPTLISGRTTTNHELGELIQAVVEAETGSESDLSLVDRSPPSPQSLTARGLRLQDPTPLKESVRSQVRATLKE